ncbi:hypothetical protein CEXT_487641 [Caerostris extrusa]|uniref:Uncharacterized protein n=1 Tax=Caerostris extrusa TaxID=172846 RepID=A0AAV4Q5T4_CAEEX|nr:hypothetical protein CEXT_487641 [Caerostris extrusa]
MLQCCLRGHSGCLPKSMPSLPSFSGGKASHATSIPPTMVTGFCARSRYRQAETLSLVAIGLDSVTCQYQLSSSQVGKSGNPSSKECVTPLEESPISTSSKHRGNRGPSYTPRSEDAQVRPVNYNQIPRGFDEPLRRTVSPLQHHPEQALHGKNVYYPCDETAEHVVRDEQQD